MADGDVNSAVTKQHVVKLFSCASWTVTGGNLCVFLILPRGSESDWKSKPPLNIDEASERRILNEEQSDDLRIRTGFLLSAAEL